MLYTIPDISKQTGIPKQRIQFWIREKGLEAKRIQYSKCDVVFIDGDDFNRFMEEHTTLKAKKQRYVSGTSYESIRLQLRILQHETNKKLNYIIAQFGEEEP